MLEQVHRLRDDETVFRDVMGPLGSRVPITAVAADLSNAKDPGLRKCLSRVRRAIARATS